MTQITLYDVLGQSFQTIPVDDLQTYQLDLSPFSEGMYFVSAQTTKGNTTTLEIIE